MTGLTHSSIYESLFKCARPVMLIIDPATGDILDANLAALDFYRYSEKEILAMNISRINILSKKRNTKRR